MIPFEFYKVLHILGVLLLFAALGGLSLTVANGATRATSSVRKLVAITHGIAMFIILLGGFGALARMGLAHGNLPGWILVKLACWVVLGVLVAIPYRRPLLARPIFWSLPVIGAIAVIMAIYKPL